MKLFQYLSTKVIVFATSSLLLISCEGSRPKRLYESGKAIYDDYEETGDPTWLIIFIVGIVVLGGLWAWNKFKDK